MVKDESCASLKLCDYGSGFTEDDIVSENLSGNTPYLVSRFYRAPEIILGSPFDYNIDLWSVGVTLYELYTTKVLFAGRSNNHMLKLMQDMNGKMPVRLLKRAKSREMYFDDKNQFLYMERDAIDPTRERLKPLNAMEQNFDLRKELAGKQLAAANSSDERKVLQLGELLCWILNSDPLRRPSLKECLEHHFITESMD